jgi:cytidyltransferase-like protein
MKFSKLSMLFETGYKDPDNPEPAAKEVALVLGRFQPLHKGHLKLIDEASKKYPVVLGIVKGKKANDKSPFDLKLQKEIAKVSSDKIIDVIELPSAAIDIAIDKFRDNGYEIKEWYAGTDRYKMYKSMIDKGQYDKKMNGSIEVKEIKRDVSEDNPNLNLDDISTYSASAIRQKIKDDDYESVDKMMIGLTPSIFKKMKSQL